MSLRRCLKEVYLMHISSFTYVENPDVINFVNEDGHVLGGFLIVYFDSGLQGGVLLSGKNHINEF